MGVRPILNMNAEGMMTNIDKVRGKNAAIDKLVEYVLKLGRDVKNHRIIIGHTDNIELANLLAERLKITLGNDLKIEFAVVNPTAGSHCGPDGVGVAFASVSR